MSRDTTATTRMDNYNTSITSKVYVERELKEQRDQKEKLVMDTHEGMSSCKVSRLCLCIFSTSVNSATCLFLTCESNSWF